MVRKHIKRDFSAHRKDVYRPTNEYIGVEIFSYNHINTITYSAYDNNIIGINSNQTNHLGWACYESADNAHRHNYDHKYIVDKYATYRIDILYELKSDYPLTGYIETKNEAGELVHREEYVFNGYKNSLKRITHFIELDEGFYTFHIRVPVNCWYYGAIVREIINYTGDNLDSAGTNLQFTEATITSTDDVKPAEISLSIGYDDAFECDISPSGFYMDYKDEINLYTHDDDGEKKQIFGGYISSILPDDNRTKLTIKGADRLIDGQNKYVLDSMYLLGGTAEITDYTPEMYYDFDSYGKALKYLCGIYELSLKNNINENYLVAGESYQTGLAGTYGTNGNVKNVHVSNGGAEESENFVTLRNNPAADKQQAFYIYSAKDHNIPPVDITDYNNFYITYGLGDPVTEVETTESVTGGDASGSTTSGSFNNYGISADGNQIMAIGRPSAPGEMRYGYTFYKSVFQRKCPACGSKELYWGIFWAGNETSNWGRFPATGRSEGGSAEGHIFCKACDADFSCIDGKDHTSPPRFALTRISGPEKCSKDDAYKLRGGNFQTATTESSASTPDTVFQDITNEAFKYAYRLGGGCSSWSCMQRVGYGDCWAFSEFIYTRLKERGVGTKIVQYATAYASNHRTTMYKDSNGNWKDFPYREYGWNTKYNNMLNNTAGSANGTVIAISDGNGIDSATGVASSESTKKTKRIREGYDKGKPFQGYIELIFSNEQSHDAPKTSLILNFTQNANHVNAYNGLKPIWINNVIKQASIDALEYMKDIKNDIDGELRYYLHAVKIKTRTQVEEFYKVDESTIDNASCKMDLYGFGFNNGTLINPTDLNSCGKTITSQLESLINQSGYLVSIEYGKHRKDDIINFRIDNQTAPVFTAAEGNENNILDWNSISYTPVSNLFNSSVYVFKTEVESGAVYKYVNTKDSNSILQYGEQITLQSTSDRINDKEAYYKARKNTKYNPKETYTYSIVVPNSPDVEVNDLVKVIADSKRLNTIKKVASVKTTYKTNRVPRVQTELGLGELSEDLQLKKVLREIRESAKKESTLFSSSAQAVDSDTLYQWEN